ncbi:MAG: hypothetical protein ACREBU_17760 [Nitrososphaera sp.]
MLASPNTGNVVDVKVVPYDVRQVPNVDATQEYSPYNLKNIIANCETVKETIVVYVRGEHGTTSVVPERILDTNITAAWFYAVDCLAVGLNEPAVLLASISVESVLNHDIRLEHLRKTEPYEWIDLHWKNLKCAYENGLPVDLLLNKGEEFRKGCRIEFVERRNKMAHGDYEGYGNLYPASFNKGEFSEEFDLGHNRPPKEHALDQIEKSKRFIISWARQNPRIRIH